MTDLAQVLLGAVSFGAFAAVCALVYRHIYRDVPMEDAPWTALIWFTAGFAGSVLTDLLWNAAGLS